MEEGPNDINQKIKRTNSQKVNQELSRRLGPSQAVWAFDRAKMQNWRNHFRENRVSRRRPLICINCLK